jgi:hypothetical protein
MATEMDGERTGIFNAVAIALGLSLCLVCEAFPLLGAIMSAWSLAFPARKPQD